MCDSFDNAGPHVLVAGTARCRQINFAQSFSRQDTDQRIAQGEPLTMSLCICTDKESSSLAHKAVERLRHNSQQPALILFLTVEVQFSYLAAHQPSTDIQHLAQ